MYTFRIDISSNSREIKYQNIGQTHTDRQTDRVKTIPRNPLRGRGNQGSICINWHSFKIETFHRKLEDKVCGIYGTFVCLFVTVEKNHLLLPFPFFGTGDGVYCFTLMTMSREDRYCQHFSGHLTLSLSHAVHLICPLAQTLRHARIYSHILLYYLQHNY